MSVAHIWLAPLCCHYVTAAQAEAPHRPSQQHILRNRLGPSTQHADLMCRHALHLLCCAARHCPLAQIGQPLPAVLQIPGRGATQRVHAQPSCGCCSTHCSTGTRAAQPAGGMAGCVRACVRAFGFPCAAVTALMSCAVLPAHVLAFPGVC